MIEILRSKPFLIAVGAGAIAQIIKVLSFLLVEKGVNYRRFVQTDGSPNMHIAAASALVMAVGFKDGFGSVIFMMAVCLTILICVDTLNVRNAASRQAEVVELIIERLWKREGRRLKRPKQGLSYRPVDMFTGAAVGIVFALLVF